MADKKFWYQSEGEIGFLDFLEKARKEILNQLELIFLLSKNKSEDYACFRMKFAQLFYVRNKVQVLCNVSGPGFGINIK